MHRFAAAAAVVALLVSGCGSGPTGSDTSPTPSASKSAEPAYLQQTDSDAINKAANPVLKAAGAATKARNVNRCNRIELLPAWRRCWHHLLDPLTRTLTGLSAAFTELSTRPFPERCVTELARAARSFTVYSRGIAGLLSGFDSSGVTARTKAATSYGSRLDTVTKGFRKPFQSVTQACYSPEVLASLNPSPSPSPAASPSG